MGDVEELVEGGGQLYGRLQVDELPLGPAGIGGARPGEVDAYCWLGPWFCSWLSRWLV